MAFDREGFLTWLPAHGVNRGGDYVHSLGKLEESHHWDLDALLPGGFAAADAQLTQELAALPTNTKQEKQQKTRLGNWRSSFRKYRAYVVDKTRSRG